VDLCFPNTILVYRARTLITLSIHDIDDGEVWIKKKLLVMSDYYGHDLTSVQNLRKKHKRLEAEVSSYERTILAIQDTCEKLMAEPMADDIHMRLQNLLMSWKELKTMAVTRGQRFDESLTYQQFAERVEEEKAWITEKQYLLSTDDLGDTMATVQVLTLS
jgi:hypothetical protein